MARTTGTASLADLVRAGILNKGERLVLNRRSAPSIEGVLQADGTILVGREQSKSPSEAARKALSVGTVDGWLRWRVPRLANTNLATLRDKA
jgi:hypothetical protein